MTGNISGALTKIVLALSPEERAAAATRAAARAVERRDKRAAFLGVPDAPLPDGWRWHVVQTEARRELTAAEEIDKLGFRLWVPSFEKEIVDKRHFSRTGPRKTTIVRRVLFPKYLFVGFARSAAWSAIAHSRGVTGMVMALSRPEPVPDPQVTRMLAAARYNFGQPVRKESKFSVGEEVRVVDGPFVDHFGAIEEVDSNLRIIALMSLFGRKVRVTFTEEMLELIE